MDTAAVILAGGMSRRMGRDKATLPFGEETMLSRLVRLYRPHFGRVAVSVNRPGRFDTAGALEVVDRRPGDGPLAGLQAAFLDTGAQAVFLTATDLPFGDPLLARYIAGRLDDGYDACLIHSSKGLEPLFAAYRAQACLEVVSWLLENGRRSMFGLFQRVRTLELPVDGIPGFDREQVERILINVTDPEEYRRALHTCQGEGLCLN